jgi:ankyrin repeat protein
LRQSLQGKSPLLHLIIADPAFQSSNDGFLGVVRLLLREGVDVDVNAVDHEGWTPLHVAASWNHYGVIQELALFGSNKLDWDSMTDDNQSAMDADFPFFFRISSFEILSIKIKKKKSIPWSWI